MVLQSVFLSMFSLIHPSRSNHHFFSSISSSQGRHALPNLSQLIHTHMNSHKWTGGNNAICSSGGACLACTWIRTHSNIDAHADTRTDGHTIHMHLNSVASTKQSALVTGCLLVHCCSFSRGSPLPCTQKPSTPFVARQSRRAVNCFCSSCDVCPDVCECPSCLSLLTGAAGLSLSLHPAAATWLHSAVWASSLGGEGRGEEGERRSLARLPRLPLFHTLTGMHPFSFFLSHTPSLSALFPCFFHPPCASLSSVLFGIRHIPQQLPKHLQGTMKMSKPNPYLKDWKRKKDQKDLPIPFLFSVLFLASPPLPQSHSLAPSHWTTCGSRTLLRLSGEFLWKLHCFPFTSNSAILHSGWTQIAQ